MFHAASEIFHAASSGVSSIMQHVSPRPATIQKSPTPGEKNLAAAAALRQEQENEQVLAMYDDGEGDEFSSETQKKKKKKKSSQKDISHITVSGTDERRRKKKKPTKPEVASPHFDPAMAEGDNVLMIVPLVPAPAPAPKRQLTSKEKGTLEHAVQLVQDQYFAKSEGMVVHVNGLREELRGLDMVKPESITLTDAKIQSHLQSAEGISHWITSTHQEIVTPIRSDITQKLQQEHNKILSELKAAHAQQIRELHTAHTKEQDKMAQHGKREKQKLVTKAKEVIHNRDVESKKAINLLRGGIHESSGGKANLASALHFRVLYFSLKFQP